MGYVYVSASSSSIISIILSKILDIYLPYLDGFFESYCLSYTFLHNLQLQTSARRIIWIHVFNKIFIPSSYPSYYFGF